ncbi:MAG: C10 family peptidase [Muribaculaceae bacterium]|nr:C10 family peptidase [Muribaculaceae bacterium]
MKKRAILLFSTLMCVFAFMSCSNEQPVHLEMNNENSNLVSIDDALSNADEMFRQVYGQTRSDRKAASVIRFRNKQTRANSAKDSEGFYIVNYNDGGFSLLSADKRDVNRVYAISNEGAFHLGDTVENPGLGIYVNEILPVLSFEGIGDIRYPYLPIDTIMPIDPGWSYFKKHSEPLLSGFMAKFHQTYPYNAYCNTGAPDYRQQYVGCVPLAAGTVMGYHKWPQSLDGYVFDWGAMYSSSADSRWARLFKILGGPQYTNVTYGVVGASTGSGVSWDRVPQAFAQAFAKANYKGGNTQDFSSSTVNTELEAGYPVICVGINAGSGHAWVIDGGYTQGSLEYPVTPDDEIRQVYKTYYHCVWGSNGVSNGYYLYSTTLGRDLQKGDEGYIVSAGEYGNLKVSYGYRPNK